MQRDYGGVIWTNHALTRMQERGIAQGDAWITWRKPDNSKYAKAEGAWTYYRTWGDQTIEVVAKKNEKGEWIILSVWSKKNLRKQKSHSVKEKRDSVVTFFLKRIFG